MSRGVVESSHTDALSNPSANSRPLRPTLDAQFVLQRPIPSATVKSFHVTTFGCQMNEHDSERMKGMLESIGYREVPDARRRRPDPLQHLLDPREGRRPVRLPPARGEEAQAARPGAGDRRRRLLGPVRQGAGVPPVPVRRRRVRPGPGAQARRVPHGRLDHRAGLLRVRGLHRPPAVQARAGVPGVDADLGRLQLPLHLLHRAVHARARGQPAARRAGRRGRARRRRRRARDHAARPERQLVRPRPAAAGGRSPSSCRRSTRSTGSTASATPARTRRTCART